MAALCVAFYPVRISCSCQIAQRERLVYKAIVQAAYVLAVLVATSKAPEESETAMVAAMVPLATWPTLVCPGRIPMVMFTVVL